MDALSRRDLACVITLADPAVEWHSFFAELGDEGFTAAIRGCGSTCAI